MRPEDETSELELIAKALQEISKAITHERLAKALLKAALGYSRAARGAGRMGRHRWNTPTLLSRGSSQCSRIFDFDTDLNPVPFEASRHGGQIWVVEENKMRGTTFTCALPPRQSAQMSGSC
jgi:hypothetical protein